MQRGDVERGQTRSYPGIRPHVTITRHFLPRSDQHMTPWQLLESAIRDKENPRDPGDLALAAEALARGADLNHRSPDGWTALMFAAAEDDAPMVDWLIAQGAHPEERAVLEAARFDAAASMAALLKHGISTEYDEHGDTPATLAAREGCYRVIPLLAASGADLDRRDDDAKSARTYLERAGRRDLLGGR